MGSGIKSKGSKQKARRWSFAITVGEQGFHVPVICFGTNKKANEVANKIRENYSDIEALKGKDFEVNLIPHETISITTQQQFDGLELEGRLLSRVSELIYDDLLLLDNANNDHSLEAKRKAIGMYVVKAKASLMKEMYPEGAKAIEDSIEREATALESTDNNEAEYKMPLGIHAVKEALDGRFNEDQC